MASDEKATVESLLHQLVGKRTWGLVIGPAGVHLHLGEIHEDPNPKAKPFGDYSVWIKGSIRITSKGHTFWESGPCQGQDDQARLSSLASDRTVSEAAADWHGNILRLVLDEAHLLSAYPLHINNRSFPWIIYDHTHVPVRYAVVSNDGVELFVGGG